MFEAMGSLTGQAVVDVAMHIEGSRLVGTDVYADGQRGIIKSDLGTYKTPEHAAAMALLIGRVDFFLIAGTVTDEQFDRLAEESRKRKNATIPTTHQQ